MIYLALFGQTLVDQKLKLETCIARTACDSREMRKTCVEAFSGPLSHLSPKLCENCARTTFAHFLLKNGALTQPLHSFSESAGTQAGSVRRTISTQFSQPGALFFRSAAVQDTDVSSLNQKRSFLQNGRGM